MSEVVAGYTIKTVAARIADMDFDAAGNAEKAAWKRYVALCLMAIAKGSEKADVVAMVFGKGGKASKTFHNAWTLANKCRGHVTGNMAWSDILPMGIEDAFSATISMINTHMAVLGVAGKNEWDKVCNMSLAEVEAKREADKHKPSEAEGEGEADASADNGKAEADAQAAAAAKPERDIAQEAIALLATANRTEIVAVIASLQGQLVAGDIVDMVGNMLESLSFDHVAAIGDMVAARKAVIAPQTAKVRKAA